ncbi:MAG: hypothetical protein R3A50_13545 [Saprospiraceae bacterium]
MPRFRMLMVHLRKHHERQNTFQMANLFQNTKALLSPLFMLPKAWVAPEPLTLLFLRDDNTHTQGEISRFGALHYRHYGAPHLSLRRISTPLQVFFPTPEAQTA